MNDWSAWLHSTFGGGQPAQPAQPQIIQVPGATPLVAVPNNKGKTGTTNLTTTNRAVPVTQDDARKMGDTRNMLVQDYLKSFRDQEAGVQEQMGRLGDVEQATRPVGANLSPMLALADAWGKHKSNLAGAYTAPMAPEERAVLLSKLDNSIQSQRSKLTTADLAILKTLLPAGNMTSAKNGTTEETGTGTTYIAPKAPPRPSASQLPDPKGYMRDFDKAIAGQKKAKEAADMVTTALASGKLGPAAAQSMITIASGESARHAAQIENKFQGDPAFVASLHRAFQKAKDGTLDENDQESFRTLARAYAGSHEDTMNSIYNDYTTNRYQGYRLTPEEAQARLQQYKPVPRAPKAAEPSFDLKDIIRGYMNKGGR